MAAAELLTDASRALDANGSPLSGATWRFYATGTTTPQSVYADADLSTSLGSIVTADSAGRFVPVYFDATKVYRGILRDANGNTLPGMDIDPINNGVQASLNDLISDFSGTGGAALIGTTLGGNVQQVLEILRNRDAKTVYVTDPAFGAVGDDVADDAPAFQDAIDYLAANGGGILFVPAAPVAYKWLSPVKYVGTDPIAIVGIGVPSGTAIGNDGNIPLIKWAGATNQEILCAESSSTDGSVALSGFHVQNLMIQSPIQAKASGGVGLALRGVYPFTVDNVTITGPATGFMTDDNPAASGAVAVRCGKGAVRDLRVASAANRRMSLRGTCDSYFQGLECLEETIAAYDYDLYISIGTNGGRTDSLSFYESAFVANGLTGVNRPASNVYIEGEGTLWINFTDCAFEISKTASVRILLPTLADASVRTATFTNCWWNDHEGYCGDFQRAHVDLINPRGWSNGAASTFRFVGDPADLSSPRLGGGVIGGLVNYAGTAGIEVLAAAGIGIYGVNGNRIGGTGPLIQFQGNATECTAIGNKPSAGAASVADFSTANSNIVVDQSQIRMPLASIGNFADDAAAAAGGYKIGQFYRTGSALKIRAV